jgi:hypothetical protein
MNPRPRTIVLDSQGLSRTAARDHGMQLFLTAAVRQGSRVVVPTVILAEIITGKPTDAQVWHAVNQLVTHDITREIAAEAGALRERAASIRVKKKDLTVNAVVAAVACAHAPALLLTSDVTDLTTLCAGADVRVHPIGFAA